MGGSSKQTIGYQYFSFFLLFIGNPIEKMLGINFDKRGWHTPLIDKMGNPLSVGVIEKATLYGENEGGVAGQIHARYGTENQEVVSFYKEYMESKGLQASAYPYQSYLAFPDFYVGNSGYMKEMLLWPKRIHVRNDGRGQWYDIKAEIPDYKNNSGSGGGVIERPLYNRVSTIYGTSTASFSDDAKLETSVADQELTGLPMLYSIDGSYNYVNAENYSVAGAYGGDFDFVKAGYKLDFGEITGLVRLIVISQNTSKTYFEDEQTNANILSSKVLNTLVSENRGVEVKRRTLEYILLIEEPGKFFKFELESSSSVFGDGSSFLESWVYFEPQGIDSFAGASDEILSGDLNPIHKIREILTDDTAMNKPESSVNDENFIKAADRIYDEGLGISWAITEKSCMDAINELCYHTEAGIRVNRQTGLYEMVLFRDNWFEEDEIHTISESKIKSMQYEITNADEVINQVNVNFYDRANIKNSSFSISESGLIQTLGRVNAETLDFPYFMKIRNAEIVANWKLKQLSTGAFKGSFTTGWREARKWNRYDLICLPWSKRWTGTVLVRIMSINLGGPTNNQVTIEYIEVVPATGMMNTTIVIDEPIDKPLPPQACQYEPFELPYYLAVMALGQRKVDEELAYENNFGLAGVVAEQPQSNSLYAIMKTHNGVDGEEWLRAGSIQYSQTADLDQSISKTSSSFTVKNWKKIANVPVGTLIKCGRDWLGTPGEWMVFQGVDPYTGVISVKRGALDTPPQEWGLDTKLYFCGTDVAFDETEYVAGEEVLVSVLTTTPSGVLEQGGSIPVEMKARAIRPYPPANVKINGAYWPETQLISNNIVLTWMHRNREQQTGGEIIGWYEGDVTIENGVTYSYELISDSTVLASANGVAANTVTIPASVLIPNMPHILRLWAVRDGYTSYQKFEHSFFVEAASLILTATATPSQVSGNTVPVANISVNVEESLKANLEFDGSSISGKAPAGSTITIEVQE